MKNKDTFLSLLALGLSWNHSYHDMLCIVEDYDEWFENEKGVGKPESEIGRNLSIFRIIKENNSMRKKGESRLWARLRNPIFWFLLLVLVRFLGEIYFLKDNWYRRNYELIVFLSNLIFPILEGCMVTQCSLRTPDHRMQNHRRIVLGGCMIFFAGALLTAILFFIPGYLLQGRFGADGALFWRVFTVLGAIVLVAVAGAWCSFSMRISAEMN